MADFDTPVYDLAHAKALFHAMGCSHFHMSRDYPARYDEYRGLHIDPATERDWTWESLAAWHAQMLDRQTPAADLWWIHSRLVQLANLLRSAAAVELVYAATRKIMERLQPEGCLLVAENLIGRHPANHRDGIIVPADALGLQPLARELATLAFTLIDRALQHGYDPPRCTNARRECTRLVARLKLSR